jgi:hypothetical protein
MHIEQVAHTIKMASFVFFKGIPLSSLLGVECKDKVQRSLGGKSLCAHLLFAVDYSSRRSCLLRLQSQWCSLHRKW